ncbi:helix-turn-helix domain-containing protein [Pseudomonas putida]
MAVLQAAATTEPICQSDNKKGHMNAPNFSDSSASQDMPFAANSVLRSRDLDNAQSLLNSHLDERQISLRDQRILDINFTLQSLPQVKLFGAQWGSEVCVRSRPLNAWHGIFPLQGAIRSHPDDLQAGCGELLLFAPGHEVNVIWKEGTKAIVIALDAPLVSDYLKRHHEVEPPRLANQTFLFEGSHPAVRSLGSLLRLVDSETGNASGLLATPASQSSVQHLFCENLLQLIPSLQALPQRRLLPSAVKRVVDYIHAHLDQPLCITELVSISGSSRRSLEQAFRNGLQTSPQRYIQACRLRAIREILLRHQPGDVQVSELALRWGFAQPSHFTAAYKQAFGELPSRTLARPV